MERENRCKIFRLPEETLLEVLSFTAKLQHRARYAEQLPGLVLQFLALGGEIPQTATLERLWQDENTGDFFLLVWCLDWPIVPDGEKIPVVWLDGKTRCEVKADVVRHTGEWRSFITPQQRRELRERSRAAAAASPFLAFVRKYYAEHAASFKRGAFPGLAFGSSWADAVPYTLPAGYKIEQLDDVKPVWTIDGKPVEELKAADAPKAGDPVYYCDRCDRVATTKHVCPRGAASVRKTSAVWATLDSGISVTVGDYKAKGDVVQYRMIDEPGAPPAADDFDNLTVTMRPAVCMHCGATLSECGGKCLEPKPDAKPVKVWTVPDGWKIEQAPLEAMVKDGIAKDSDWPISPAPELKPKACKHAITGYCGVCATEHEVTEKPDTAPPAEPESKPIKFREFL